MDISDLAARLYGEGARWVVASLLVTINSLILMCYIMYFGTQTDQLVCKTFKAADCGYHRVYAIYIVLALFPVVYLRRLALVGWVSLFVLIFTFTAIIIIIYTTANILSKSP